MELRDQVNLSVWIQKGRLASMRMALQAGLVVSLLFLTSCKPIEEPEIPSPPNESVEAKPLVTWTPLPSTTLTLTAERIPTETDTPTPTTTDLPEGVELIQMRTSDGIDLVGYLRKTDNPTHAGLVVVLAHGYTQTHQEWVDFEVLLHDNGFPTMTFDFRGHGSSSGSHQFATIGVDVTAVLKFVKKEGYQKVICVGASMGGIGCLAASVDSDIQGLVLLSSTLNPEAGPRLTTTTDLQTLTIPKVFMFTDEDYFGPEYVEVMGDLAEKAPEPKAVHIFPGIGHGTGLFYEEYGEEVFDILLKFIQEISGS